MHDTITKQDVAKARQMLAMCSNLEAKLQVNEACGLDCQELRQRCEDAKQFLIKFTQVFQGK